MICVMRVRAHNLVLFRLPAGVVLVACKMSQVARKLERKSSRMEQLMKAHKEYKVSVRFNLAFMLQHRKHSWAGVAEFFCLVFGFGDTTIFPLFRVIFRS